MKDLRDRIAEILRNYAAQYGTGTSTYDYVDEILTLLEKCPAMTIEDCPWGKKNVEFREIFLRGMNRQFEGIKVKEECSCENGKLRFWSDTEDDFVSIDHERCHGTGKIYRPATWEDIDLKDLINHYDYPCDKDHAPKTPTGGKLVVKS